MQDPSMQQNNLFAWRFYYAENGRLDDHIHSKTPDAMMNNIHINEALALRCELWHGFFLLLQVGLAYLAAQLGSSANSYRAKATQPVSQALHASRQSLLRASEQELPTRMVRASAPL
ncbi:MAG: hypothetical protein A3J38_02525 [Gammaproteobacteria bacterium RIFCSPHIGHO2_12_FULL_45_9]|nr:MAG: hypothetical protein A3J38_02525 [Gammaproteobacteria bacterium RIFCSPHIGHO2_12_FULL_45_9]